MKPVKKRKTLTKDNHIHLLKGLLKCGQCDTALTPYPAGKKDKNGVPYLYYACGKVVDFGKHSDCKVRMIPAREFENAIKKCLADLGRNKALIESTVKNSTKFTKKRIRPLQTEKNKTEQLLAKTTAEINRLVKIMKSKDLVGKEITEEYKKLLNEKRLQENNVEKLAIDIERCTQDMLDAEMIKKTLMAFDKVVSALPIEDQKDLFNLLIKQITVWSFDPKREKAPKKSGAFVTKIRTKWYRIKLDLYQFPDIDAYYRSMADKGTSSDSTTKWLPSPLTKRTSHIVFLHMPIHIRYDSKRRVSIVEGEAPYQISTNERITKTLLKRHKPVKLKPNPIQTALKYDKLRRGLSNPSLAEVARHVGVSRARICQMLNLLKLDKRIVDYVANITDPKENNFWTERKLRRLNCLDQNSQWKIFKNIS